MERNTRAERLARAIARGVTDYDVEMQAEESGASVLSKRGQDTGSVLIPLLCRICSIGLISDVVWDFRIEYESLSFFFLPPARYVIIIIG